MPDQSSIVDINVDDAMDLVAVEAGEYTLRIVSAKVVGPSEKGNIGLSLLYEIVGQESAAPIGHYLMFPNSEQDARVSNGCKLGLRDFYAAFGATPPFDTKELINMEASASVSMKAEDDPQYADINGFVNKVARFIAAK